MSEMRKGGGGFPSEASRMLEAALEQMDGIIQGAKYELPQQFDSFTIQVGLVLSTEDYHSAVLNRKSLARYFVTFLA
jgi:predicted Zn-dependent protease with MMP-like domain